MMEGKRKTVCYSLLVGVGVGVGVLFELVVVVGVLFQ